MAIKIRLARGGSKKRPFYRVVAADNRMPRDGRFIEKLGTYNPLLPKEHPERIKLNVEKIQEWMGKGAQLSDRISRMLENLSVVPTKSRNNPKKGLKHKATEEREKAKSEKKDAPVDVVKKENPNEQIDDQDITVNEEKESEITSSSDEKMVETQTEAPLEEKAAETQAEAPPEEKMVETQTEAPLEEKAAETQA
ncbi:MAG: 30S ribosomal protein S16, partial [Rhodobacteraceae bacterium]